jgi:ABC-type transport system involved in multi-copper enzyme maturation permease subunit
MEIVQQEAGPAHHTMPRRSVLSVLLVALLSLSVFTPVKATWTSVGSTKNWALSDIMNDIPRKTWIVSLLLFATAIGYVIVSGDAKNPTENLLYSPPVTMRQTVGALYYHAHIAKTAGSTFGK